MGKETRQALATVCYGIALVVVGVPIYFVDLELISAVGALVFSAGGILIVLGLVNVGRSLSQD